MLGAFFALLAAATFGLNNTSVRRGVLTGSVFQALGITVWLGVVMFLLTGLVTGALFRIPDLSDRQLLLFTCAGVIHFLWGRYCNYRAVRAIGSNLAGAMVQLQIPILLCLALVFLGEQLTILKSIGIVCTFAGSAITLYDRGTPTAPTPSLAAPNTTAAPKFVPNMVEGITFGMLSAVGYAVGPTLVRAGLIGTGDSVAGACVSYFSAGIFLAVLVLFLPQQRRQLFAIDRTALPWFMISGVAVNVSQFFVYLALAIAPATVVAPLVQLYIVFRLIFAWFINREYEVFDLRIVAGILLALTGAALLAIDPALIADFLGLSPGARHVLDLAWP